MKTGLILNSCFFGFFCHFGFARELERAGVEIGAASGSSAGAIVAAAVASGLGTERGLEMALSLTRDDFWDPDPWHRAVRRLGRVRGERLEKLLEAHLPVARIEDCKLPLVISAVSLPLLSARLLARGPLARAVHASCALPLLLQPVAWPTGELLLDGGVRIEAPVRGLLERTRLGTAIVHVASWREPLIPPGLRREIAFAKRAGIEVHLARTRYPRLDPDHLERAPEAVEAGAASARRLIRSMASTTRRVAAAS